MVKQLGISTIFTFSCADLRCNELMPIIPKINSLDISGDDLHQISNHEESKFLNQNPMIVARHFQ